MGGDFLIGIIVFLILVTINFLVITKGATRIAEVGARFTLDAILGKGGRRAAQRRRSKIAPGALEHQSCDSALFAASPIVRMDMDHRGQPTSPRKTGQRTLRGLHTSRSNVA
jgi:hypothetical protein